MSFRPESLYCQAYVLETLLVVNIRDRNRDKSDP